MFDDGVRRKFFLFLSLLLHYVKTEKYIDNPNGGSLMKLYRRIVFKDFTSNEVASMHTAIMSTLNWCFSKPVSG
jgi:hypothetical protein